MACRVYPPGRPSRSVGSPSRGQGFAHYSEAPRLAWPKRVHLRYGLVILLRLLSTLPPGNAVTTVGFRPVTLAWKGLSPFCSNAFTGARVPPRRGEELSLGVGVAASSATNKEQTSGPMSGYLDESWFVRITCLNATGRYRALITSPAAVGDTPSSRSEHAHK